jgi:hypothetical protein
VKQIKRTDQEIESLIGDCADAEAEGSRFPGMTYEQGIDAALRWVFGEQDEHPLAE